MAAFSYQHPPFVLDSVFFPTITTPMKMSAGFMGEGNIPTTTNTCFSQFCPSESFHEVPAESRFLHEQKLSTDSSSVVDRLEFGEQVTQKVAPMERKRKSRDGSSLTSAQSKVHSTSKFFPFFLICFFFFHILNILIL